ncbi:PD40 domain-containing protein [Litoribacter ruber]|uniref:Tricorn protease homolog n=1 Tax=Litoribacter ruber TaxID=702568 RepID=A0AAP2CJU5_9BACT|nr:MULTISPECIES: S41 family peptidase [Litoribacter]MBS9525014.1 PD40 domain-containing protein [Litoribacter alkaliphilus]MBT0811827.1 PD40 domain-containing protein [Litoribacter ruber]
MKSRLGIFLLALMSTQAFAQEDALWMRYPAISPDGKDIAFTYKGDIYKVPSSGGRAIPVTTHPGYEFRPTWSEDGKKIAFASDRHGNFDVFVADAEFGRPERLTYHSTNDYPAAFNSQGVIFTSSRLPAQESSHFPYGRFQELYLVSLDGKLPKQLLSIPMDEVQPNKAGNKYLYQDLKGYEDTWRKKHTSAITRDIWLYDAEKDSHIQLTTFEGEDRSPVWSADEKTVYYLSEEGGSSNVWKLDLENPESRQQITDFETHPVRFLSIAGDNTLTFGYNGEIYTFKEGHEPHKVSIQIPFDEKSVAISPETLTNGATEMAVSPDGKEVAFIVRGEVFVTNTESNTTKRITNTPEQERSVTFSPDGKKLLYAAERNGSWNLYESKIRRSGEEPYFYISTILEETPLLETDRETFQPNYSPDGKEVAFLEDRTTLKILNLDSKQVRTVLPGDKNYSYSDGDQYFEWSPDSKWLLVTFIEKERWVTEVGLVDASGKEPVVNLTQSGYIDDMPKWGYEGNVITWHTDKMGFRSHGSWGSQGDIFAMYLNQETFDRFKLSKDEFTLLEEREKEEKKNGENDEKDKPANPINIQLKNLEDRVVRITPNSSSLSDAVLSPDGKKLYYLSYYENGHDLWETDLIEKKTKVLTKLEANASELYLDKKGENAFIQTSKGIKKVKLEDGTSKDVSFAAQMDLNTPAEREYIFDHMWRQVREKFYVTDLHGVDWESMKENYERFLPHINNDYDFAEMSSELLGELNASHTGMRYSHKDSKGDQTASLGAFYDPNHSGKGLKILEVIDKSPLEKATGRISAGDIIEKIDGVEVTEGMNYYSLLNRKADKPVLLTVRTGNGNSREVAVRPITQGQESELLYQRWVKSRRAETERLSDGRLGYVHVRGMNSPSFREVFAELMGRYYDKEAVIVDTRFNGGGWLHDDLATLLSGEKYVTLFPRGQVIGSEPQNKWAKPSVVLMGEGNYSDAHFFPVAYKALNIGKTIGMPVPGTTTAVWWETQINPNLVFGIPQVGVQDMEGDLLENKQLDPDIQVKNEPGMVDKGRDQQLERAVEELLKEVKVAEKR